MRHDTTVHAVLGGIGVRVVRVDIKDNPVGSGRASAKDITAFKNRKLIQGLAVALGVELEPLVVAKLLWVAT